MPDEKRTVAVVGGGASGLAAAVIAARSGSHVCIFESGARVGKSVRIAGDSRCNIANAHTEADLYRNAGFVRSAFGVCSPEDVLDFLGGLGLLLREEDEGRLYPQTNKGTSVVDAFRLALRRYGALEVCDCFIECVRELKDAWAVRVEGGEERRFDRVIIACGGSIPQGLFPKDVSLVRKSMVLGPIKTDTAALRGLDKVRVKCALDFGDVREVGEITFKSYGVSGIAAYNISRLVKPGDCISIDFLPAWNREKTQGMLQARMDALKPRVWLDFTCGMLLPLVARAVLAQAGIDPEAPVDPKDFSEFSRALHAFPLTVRGMGEANLCQVKRGGVAVECVDPETMGVKGYPGLYAVGEALDVDAPCGGYNLHWAWASGIIAGSEAIR